MISSGRLDRTGSGNTMNWVRLQENISYQDFEKGPGLVGIYKLSGMATIDESVYESIGNNYGSKW